MPSMHATVVNGTFDIVLVLESVADGPSGVQDDGSPIPPGGTRVWTDEYGFAGFTFPDLVYQMRAADGSVVGRAEISWAMGIGSPWSAENTFLLRIYDGDVDPNTTLSFAKVVKADYVWDAKVAFIVGGGPGAWTATVSPSSAPATGETTGGGLVVLRWQFIGSFLTANDKHAVIAEQAWPDFEATHADFESSGLAITQVCTFGSGDGRRWAGVYRALGFKTDLRVNLTIEQLMAEFNSRYGTDCLIGIETYVEDDQRLWAGIWQIGRTDDHILYWDWGQEGFQQESQNDTGNGFPLSVAKHYQDGAEHRWAGIAHPGDYGTYVELDMDATRLGEVWAMNYPTMILVNIDSYRTQVNAADPGTTRFAGVWHVSPIGNGLSWGVDADGLVDEFTYWHGQGLRLATMTPYLWDGTF